MILPYTYRDFTIEGFYDPDESLTKMYFTAYATHPDLDPIYSKTGETWEDAKQAIETEIDEMIASWN